MSKSLLIIFVKNPEKGKVKTRLAATIGDKKALVIYKLLLQRTYDITRHLSEDRAVYYSEKIEEIDLWDDGNYDKKLQSGAGLGEKMSNAISEGFDAGYNNVCIIGSDCYELTQEIIEGAFNTLSSKDTVLGPSKDGGYYLLGMKKMHSSIFTNKKWSTASVFDDTAKSIENLGLSLQILKKLSDVDVEKDLQTIPKLSL